MRTVKTQDLTPGMITAEPVLSKHGQLIVAADTELTNQMIAHLSYYNIPSASILDGTIPPAAIASMQKTEQVTLSYSQKIRSSRSFQRFKSDYVKKIRFLKSSLNDLIDRTDPIDQAELLSESVGLFGKQSTTISIFDNLHNMRQIDDSTYAHCLNVSIISRMFGMWLKYSDEDLDVLTLAGLLHDIGKCKIPNAIISKKGKLTDAEYEVIKAHAQLGYDILKDQPLDERIKNAALMHHERYDGSGYPNHLPCACHGLADEDGGVHREAGKRAERPRKGQNQDRGDHLDEALRHALEGFLERDGTAAPEVDKREDAANHTAEGQRRAGGSVRERLDEVVVVLALCVIVAV